DIVADEGDVAEQAFDLRSPRGTDQLQPFLTLQNQTAAGIAAIEISELMRLVIERRVHLITQPGRDFLIWHHAPFILDESAVVISKRLAVRTVLRELCLVGETEQHSGNRVGIAAAAGERAGEEIVAVLVAREERNVVLIIQAAKFESALDGVRALDPRDV